MSAAVHDQLRAAEVFQKSYSSYQGLYEGDYIGHRAAYEALKPLLRGKGSSFSMLDLGCGDAWAICKTLAELVQGSALREYVGVDLSSPAIDLAKGNLERLNPACSCQWHVTDMLSYMRHSKQHADIIIASFSMHHLTPEDKLAVLQEGHRLLAASKGIFCMVDVLRGPAESVQDYRDRICSFAAREWMLVDPAGRQAMIDHMQAYDMPDALEDFANMSQQAGFARMQHAYLSSNKYGNLIVFEC